MYWGWWSWARIVQCHSDFFFCCFAYNPVYLRWVQVQHCRIDLFKAVHDVATFLPSYTFQISSSENGLSYPLKVRCPFVALGCYRGWPGDAINVLNCRPSYLRSCFISWLLGLNSNWSRISPHSPHPHVAVGPPVADSADTWTCEWMSSLLQPQLCLQPVHWH